MPPDPVKMVSINKFKSKYLLLLLAIFICVCASAQQNPTPLDQSRPPDSTKVDFFSRLKKLEVEEKKESALRFNLDKKSIKQNDLLEQIRKTTEKANLFIEAGIDTAGIEQKLEKMEAWAVIAGDGVFTNKGTAQTHINLSTTSKILFELFNQSNATKNQIDTYEKKLVNFRYQIDSLGADPVVYEFPPDSINAVLYLQKLLVVSNGIKPAEKGLKNAIDNIQNLQVKVNAFNDKMKAQLDELEGYQATLYSRTFDREFTSLWEQRSYFRPFSEILHFSYIKVKFNFLFYIRNNSGKITLHILLVLSAIIFLRRLQGTLIQNRSIGKLNDTLVINYPTLSAIIIALNLGQFIFPEPPFVFNSLFWIISSVCLTIMLRQHLSKHLMTVWLIFFVLFVFSCLANQLLQASRFERWIMVVLASAGALLGGFILFTGERKDLGGRPVLFFIGFLTLNEFLSVVTNVYGRYNLSKLLLISGYLNIVIGIFFWWTIRLINEALYLASKVYVKPDKKLFYINFKRIGQKAPGLFYFFLIAGWFILLGRNFYVYKIISDPIKDFFANERTIGKYTFTINDIFIFFLIISISVIITKIVSYFASETNADDLKTGNARKVGVGSWLLLIRVGIMGIGIFLALAASGFPMERITIIIGALGVGIGFGLQAIVNNLLSGVIIAFEKPVNVNDIVEIGGQSGVVKSIGFRSSIISKWDGPDMVIPNGDLLNAHLINWTMAGSKRQMKLVVNIARGTDLEKPSQIIYKLLAANERIHQHPPPSVLFQNLVNNSIEINVLFWVKEYKDGFSVKSEMIAAIDAAFNENGIQPPFPPPQENYIPPVDEDNNKGAGNKKSRS